MAAVVYALIALATLLTKGEKCTEEECIAVENAKEKVAGVLIGWYGVPRREAWRIASDLLSGDERRAEEAVEEIKRIHPEAIIKVMEVLGQ